MSTQPTTPVSTSSELSTETIPLSSYPPGTLDEAVIASLTAKYHPLHKTPNTPKLPAPQTLLYTNLPFLVITSSACRLPLSRPLPTHMYPVTKALVDKYFTLLFNYCHNLRKVTKKTLQRQQQQSSNHVSHATPTMLSGLELTHLPSAEDQQFLSTKTMRIFGVCCTDLSRSLFAPPMTGWTVGKYIEVLTDYIEFCEWASMGDRGMGMGWGVWKRRSAEADIVVQLMYRPMFGAVFERELDGVVKGLIREGWMKRSREKNEDGDAKIE